MLVNSETALNFLTDLKDYCLEYQIENIFSGGDFFHTKARAYAPHVIQALLRLKDIHKAGIKQHMLVGNHDMSNPDNSMNSILFTFSDYVKVIPDYYFFDSGGTRIHFLSYTNKLFENFILAEGKKNILIAHLDILGFTMPNGFASKSGFKRDDFKDFDLVISGHYHKHQSQENIVYVGSPYQTNFAERDQPHGFLIVDSDTATWEFIEYLKAPKYKVITVNKLSDINTDNLYGNFIKIKLVSHKISKSKLRERLYDLGARSADVIPPEDVKEIEKYYDNTFGEEPSQVALSYINNIRSLDINKDELLEYFTKIEEFATNMSEFELDEV